MLHHRPPRRVFLSYTSELCQFPPSRSFVAAAESAIARSGDAVSSMSYLSVRDQSVATACEAEVSHCDVYVLIAGFRYGTPVRDRPRMSYTELEFRAATAANIPRFVFVLDEHAAGPATMFLDQRFGKRQATFRAELLRDNLVSATVREPGDLEIRLLQALGSLQPVPDRRVGQPSAFDLDVERTEALSAVRHPAAARTPRSRKRRGSRVLLLATGVVALLASVVVGVSLATSDQSHGSPAPPPPTTTTTTTTTTTAAAAITDDTVSSTAASDGPDSAADTATNSSDGTAQKPIIDEEVAIPRLAAADIDKSPAAVKEGQVGPTGDFDLYHDSDAFRVHTGSIFGYPSGASTAPDKAFAICADYTGPSPSSNPEVPAIGVAVDDPFCFVTSAHHLAWAEVVGIQGDTQSATVHVRVWDKTVNA